MGSSIIDLVVVLLRGLAAASPLSGKDHLARLVTIWKRHAAGALDILLACNGEDAARASGDFELLWLGGLTATLLLQASALATDVLLTRSALNLVRSLKISSFK